MRKFVGKYFNMDAFILSMPRSGSTLLRLELNKFEHVFALPETQFFSFLHNLPKHLSFAKSKDEIIRCWLNFHRVNRWDIDKARLAEALKNTENLRDILDFSAMELYRNTATNPIETPFLIEKSPPHIFFQTQIRNFYPNAKFIYLIRDPRDVIGSLKGMAWSSSNVYTLARSWKVSTQLMTDPNSIFVKYENLVTDAENEIKKMADFLNLKKIDAVMAKKKASGVKADLIPEKTFKSIDTSNLDKWKKQLSGVDFEAEIIEKICAKEMEKFGYVPVKKKVRNFKFYGNLYANILKHAVNKL